MSRRVLRRFAAVACVLGIVLAPGSCDLLGGGDNGFFGNSFTIQGLVLYSAGKTDFESSTFGGTIDFGMQGSAGALASASVTSGEFSVQVNAPGAAGTSPWNSILPSVTLTISDATAKVM